MFEMLWMMVGAVLALTIRRLVWIWKWKLNKAKLDRESEAELAEMKSFFEEFISRSDEEARDVMKDISGRSPHPTLVVDNTK